MKYVIVGIIIVIAVLAWVLSRRGSSGLGSSGSSDSESGALGQALRNEGPGGAGSGFGG